MILVQGCSFSYGQGIKNIHRNRYSALLENRLQERVWNISHEGKCNFVASDELHTFLLLGRYNEAQLPRVIIWQLTDTFRRGLPMSRCSGIWKANNFYKQMEYPYNTKYQKTSLWQAYLKNNEHRDYLTEEEQIQHIKNHGIGSRIAYRDGNDQPIAEKSIGDTSNQYNELQTVLAIHKIQELCRSLGVQLVIVNYYGTPTQLLGDTTYKAINRNNYLIKNSERFGLYNHMMWRGFNRPDNFHFDVDSHYYQADIIYDYLTTGKKIVVEEEEHPNAEMWPVFDYADNEFPNSKLNEK